MSPGARLTVMLFLGTSNPELLRAHRMRCLASSTDAPAIPTIWIPGMPLAKDTSTVTGRASTPWTHADATANRAPLMTCLPRRTGHKGA